MKKTFRFKIEYNNEQYIAIYECGFAPMWAIYKGDRKNAKNYVKGYQAFGDTFLPSQVKEKFINYMRDKTR